MEMKNFLVKILISTLANGMVTILTGWTLFNWQWWVFFFPTFTLFIVLFANKYGEPFEE